MRVDRASTSVLLLGGSFSFQVLAVTMKTFFLFCKVDACADEFKSGDCWSSQILAAMEGLAHTHTFKQKFTNCEPIDLSQFLVID